MAGKLRCSVLYLVNFTFVLLALIKGGYCQCGMYTVVHLRAQVFIGSIYSPGYPENYPDNSRCRWLLFADPGYVIHVRVEWIELEEAVDCTYDYITFYDGYTASHKSLGKICNNHVMDIYSSGTRMLVEFITDVSVNADGFELEYSQIRPSEVPNTITPPPFLRDTTTRTIITATTTESSGSGSSSHYSWPSYSVAALIGGMAGGLVLLFVLFALARYYLARHYSGGGGRRRQRLTAQPYPPLSSGSSHLPPPPPGTIYHHHHHNNNAVFTVATAGGQPYSSPSAPYDNLAFSPYGEDPPAYFAVQQSSSTTTVAVQQLGGRGGGTVVGGPYGVLPPPPSYTEAMRLSHPSVHCPPFPVPPPPPPQPTQPSQPLPPPQQQPSSSAGQQVDPRKELETSSSPASADVSLAPTVPESSTAPQ